MINDKNSWVNKKWILLILSITIWPLGIWGLYKSSIFTKNQKIFIVIAWFISIKVLGLIVEYIFNKFNVQPQLWF